MRLIEKLANTIHGGTPSSGNGIQIRISPLLFHFCRSAVAKLKYWLEWCAWWVAQISRTRWAIR